MAGCMEHVGILGSDKKLTDLAKRKFIEEVKDVLKYGTENIPAESKPVFNCGAPLPPDLAAAEALKELEDETKFAEFHKNFFTMYEKVANSLNSEGNFSLAPALADPLALAGKLGANIPAPDFPEGYTPYFIGQLVPKLATDLVKAGKTEFILPIKLAQKLPELKTPPTPPVAAPTPLALPPSVLLGSTAASASTPATQPVTPQNALSTIAAAHAAMAEGIPKLIADVIKKMPSILTKLPVMHEVLAEICGVVSESNMFGKIEESSSTQKAVTVVLSRKTSECILINAVANTVGSAPGSMTSSIAKISSKSSKIEHYEVIPQPPIIPPPNKPTPSQRVLSRAEALAGTSFGGTDNGAYVSGLFYMEYYYARASSNVAINGSFPRTPPASPTEVAPPPKNISAFTGETLTGAGLNDKGIAISPYTLLASAVEYNVTNVGGFYDYASLVAIESSSCGLFVRSCYAAGGSSHSWFHSLYPVSTGISGILTIGYLRNYRWVKDKNGEGIVDALRKGYYYLTEDGVGTTDAEKAATENIPTVNGPKRYEIFLEDITSIPVKFDKNGSIESNQFGLTLRNGKIVPIANTVTPGGALLHAFLKPFADRAMITPDDLRAIAASNHPIASAFPALSPGDAVLVQDATVSGSEHIMLVGQARAEGFNILDKDKNPVQFRGAPGYLDPPISGIDGGQPDDLNLIPFEKDKKNQSLITYAAAEDLLKAANGPDLKTKSPVPLGTRVRDGDVVKELTQLGVPQTDKTHWKWEPINQTLMENCYSTAIRATNRNRGSVDNTGFKLGSEFIISASGQQWPGGDLKTIVAIFKAANFLDPDPDESAITSDDPVPPPTRQLQKDYALATRIMDKTEGLKRITTSSINWDILENNVFPALAAKKQAKAIAALRTAQAAAKAATPTK